MADVGLVSNLGYMWHYEEKNVKVPRVLNRLLGLPLDKQQSLFDYFSQTLDATISSAKSRGRYEEGIRTIKGEAEVAHSEVIHKDPVSGGELWCWGWW
jgi:hypothetical protein